MACGAPPTSRRYVVAFYLSWAQLPCPGRSCQFHPLPASDPNHSSIGSSIVVSTVQNKVICAAEEVSMLT